MNPVLAISRLFYRASSRPDRAFFYAFLVTAYTVAFTMTLSELSHNHTMKIVYSVFVAMPLPFTWWFLLRGFIWPIFNNKKNDDLHANAFSYLWVLVAKIISMSSIYMIMYVWEPKTFEIISVDSLRNAWAMFIAMSTYITAGTAPPSSFDTTAPLSAMIAALDLYISFFMNFVVFVTVVANTLRKVNIKSVRLPSKADDDEN